jgi:hypothetical protein
MDGLNSHATFALSDEDINNIHQYLAKDRSLSGDSWEEPRGAKDHGAGDNHRGSGFKSTTLHDTFVNMAWI